MAATVPDSGGVVFVPALTGLGAPDWDPTARGTILGITRGTTRAHLVRATLDAIAFEVRDVVELLPRITTLRVDGGAAANGLLLQLQADALGMAVERPEVLETTGLGAAFLAGLGTGVWSSTDELASTWRLDRRFEPRPAPTRTPATRRTAAGAPPSTAPRAGTPGSSRPHAVGAPRSACGGHRRQLRRPEHRWVRWRSSTRCRLRRSGPLTPAPRPFRAARSSGHERSARMQSSGGGKVYALPAAIGPGHSRGLLHGTASSSQRRRA